MHEILFGRQNEWSGNEAAVTVFKQFAGELELDQARFDDCLDGDQYASKIQSDIDAGSAAGMSGTPAFFINGGFLSGAQPFATFEQQIGYYLAGGKPPTLEVAADSPSSKGEADAPVVVTEFSDFQ
jgi:protein-disulfide isomerase